MSDETGLLWMVIFSSFGLGYVMYGRRQRAVVALICGIGLFVVPYLFDGNSLLVSGVVLLISPFIVRI